MTLFARAAAALALVALPALNPAHWHNQPAPAQLIITHARVLDVRTGNIAPSRTVVVDRGIITLITSDADARARNVTARDTLDALGGTLLPGFIDAHFHTDFIFGDSSLGTGAFLTHLSHHPDSVRAYRRQFATAYIRNGVTLVRDVGSAKQDLPLLRAWMERDPQYPDLLASGAQIVSPEKGRVSPPFQVVVRDSAEGAAQVRAYHEMGFRNIKLYWRLQPSALHGALLEANRLGMTATAHVDHGIVSFDHAMDMGVRHFEHMLAMTASLIDERQPDTVVTRMAEVLAVPRERAFATPGAGVLYTTEAWRLLGDGNAQVRALIERMASTGSTLTATLHIMAQRVGLSTFTSPPTGMWDDTRAFTPAQRERAADGYRVMARYVAEMDARGVHLAVGTDTQIPGRAVLDEILLLKDAGIPNWRVLRIATLYSAEAVGRGEEYGAIEPNRRADFVLLESDPLADIRAVVGRKTVIKDGVVLKQQVGK